MTKSFIFCSVSWIVRIGYRADLTARSACLITIIVQLVKLTHKWMEFRLDDIKEVMKWFFLSLPHWKYEQYGLYSLNNTGPRTLPCAKINLTVSISPMPRWLLLTVNSNKTKKWTWLLRGCRRWFQESPQRKSTYSWHSVPPFQDLLPQKVCSR